MEVLILEDDPALRFALSQVLEGDGHKVHATASILEASKTLENKAFDLLLLDLMIGDETSTQIADLAGYRMPNAEIVYLTGSNRFPKGELFEMTKNASWVLRKPVDFFELKDMLAHIERSSSQRRQTPPSAVQQQEENA